MHQLCSCEQIYKQAWALFVIMNTGAACVRHVVHMHCAVCIWASCRSAGHAVGLPMIHYSNNDDSVVFNSPAHDELGKCRTSHGIDTLCCCQPAAKTRLIVQHVPSSASGDMFLLQNQKKERNSKSSRNTGFLMPSQSARSAALARAVDRPRKRIGRSVCALM